MCKIKTNKSPSAIDKMFKFVIQAKMFILPI